MPSNAYSQIVINYNDTTRYCISESQARLVVSVFEKSLIHKGTIIDLKFKVSTLESKIVTLSAIDTAQTEVIALVEEVAELTEKELKRNKRKAFWNNIWQKGREAIIAISALGAGIGVGLLVK
jgi:hypothetical protein